MQQVITASWPELVELFAGVPPRAFRRLVTQVARGGGRQVADGVNGRQWSLPLADRVLLVATYYRTNLTMRQLARACQPRLRLLGVRQREPPLAVGTTAVRRWVQLFWREAVVPVTWEFRRA